ncbi:MAG: cyclic nucleotide-binding/CBS domain-containing protein [Chloroflexota bacterium]
MPKFVRDVMSRGVVTCTPDTSVREAARRLTEHGLSALVVVDARSGQLEGIVSRSDLARVYEKDVDALRVESVMSENVETIVPDIPVSAAVMIMQDRGVDRLVILHEPPAPQVPVAVLSLSDVVRDIAGLE